MEDIPNLPHFRIWCQKVLPLVYDDSLSYYEVLGKTVKYINNLIDTNKEIFLELDTLKNELKTVEKWINEFDTTYAENIIKNYIATMIFVEISEAGYITYYIPTQWENITFNTTGLDVEIPNVEYGCLVLSY